MSNQPIPGSEDHQSDGANQLQISDDQLGILLHGARSCPVARDQDGDCSDDVFNVLSSFELPPSSSTVSPQNCEISGSDQILHGATMDIGQSSGKHAECSMEMQQKESDEDTSKEDSKANVGNRQQKRRRSGELHNLTERLRRQRIKEKMQTLQELIPNCNKRDKASTLDDAIKYIRTLQYQVQMMSIGAGFTMWHSPWMLPPPPGQQGVQIPRLPPLLQTTPPRPGIGFGYDMAGPSSVSFPVSRLGMPNNPCSFASASSGLMPLHGMSDIQSVQNSDTFSFATSSDVSCAPYSARRYPSFGSQCTTQGENSPFKQ